MTASIRSIDDVSINDRRNAGIEFQELSLKPTVNGPAGHYELRLFFGDTRREREDVTLYGEGQRTKRRTVAATFGEYVEWRPGDPVRLELHHWDRGSRSWEHVETTDLTEHAAALGSGEQALAARVDALADAVEELRARVDTLQANRD